MVEPSSTMDAFLWQWIAGWVGLGDEFARCVERTASNATDHLGYAWLHGLSMCQIVRMRA